VERGDLEDAFQVEFGQGAVRRGQEVVEIQEIGEGIGCDQQVVSRTSGSMAARSRSSRSRSSRRAGPSVAALTA
jgi:hypothetical protein